MKRRRSWKRNAMDGGCFLCPPPVLLSIDALAVVSPFLTLPSHHHRAITPAHEQAGCGVSIQAPSSCLSSQPTWRSTACPASAASSTTATRRPRPTECSCVPAGGGGDAGGGVDGNQRGRLSRGAEGRLSTLSDDRKAAAGARLARPPVGSAVRAQRAPRNKWARQR